MHKYCSNFAPQTSIAYTLQDTRRICPL